MKVVPLFSQWKVDEGDWGQLYNRLFEKIFFPTLSKSLAGEVLAFCGNAYPCHASQKSQRLPQFGRWERPCGRTIGKPPTRPCKPSIGLNPYGLWSRQWQVCKTSHDQSCERMRHFTKLQVTNRGTLVVTVWKVHTDMSKLKKSNKIKKSNEISQTIISMCCLVCNKVVYCL